MGIIKQCRIWKYNFSSSAQGPSLTLAPAGWFYGPSLIIL